MTTPRDRDEARQAEYRFDAIGYYVQRGFLSAAVLAAARHEFERLDLRPDDWFPAQLRASNIHLFGGVLGELATSLHESETTRRLIGYPPRLLESTALERRSGRLDLHGGASEFLADSPGRDISTRSWVQDGRLYSLRTKVLLYLDDVHESGHGRLIYVEGSHKAALSFHRAFPKGRDAAADLVRPVEVRAGDAIWINEGLMHGAEPKTTANRRRLLAYTFGPTFMADWNELHEVRLTSSGYVSTNAEKSENTGSET